MVMVILHPFAKTEEEAIERADALLEETGR